jgi:hypothetical protein
MKSICDRNLSSHEKLSALLTDKTFILRNLILRIILAPTVGTMNRLAGIGNVTDCSIYDGWWDRNK